MPCDDSMLRSCASASDGKRAGPENSRCHIIMIPMAREWPYSDKKPLGDVCQTALSGEHVADFEFRMRVRREPMLSL